MNRAKVSRRTKAPKCPQVTDARALQAILFIGAILKAVQPEEGDDERRELERLVAQANARRKEKKTKKDAHHAKTKAAASETSRAATPEAGATAAASEVPPAKSA